MSLGHRLCSRLCSQCSRQLGRWLNSRLCIQLCRRVCPGLGPGLCPDFCLGCAAATRRSNSQLFSRRAPLHACLFSRRLSLQPKLAKPRVRLRRRFSGRRRSGRRGGGFSRLHALRHRGSAGGYGRGLRKARAAELPEHRRAAGTGELGALLEALPGGSHGGLERCAAPPRGAVTVEVHVDIGRCPSLGLQLLAAAVELLDEPLLLRPDPLLEAELSGFVPPVELLLLLRGGQGLNLRLGARHKLGTAGTRPNLFGLRSRAVEVRRRGGRLAARLPLLDLPPLDTPPLPRLHRRGGLVFTIVPPKLNGQGAHLAAERPSAGGLGRRRAAFDEDGLAHLA